MEFAQLCLILSSLTVSPERSQFRHYETIILSCAANSTGWMVRRNTSYHFSQKCQFGWGVPKESSCKIDTAYPSDSGAYWCENNHGGCSNVVNLTVTASPLILESPVHPVTEGDSVTLRCSYKDERLISSTSNFSTNFYKDGQLIGEEKEGRMVITIISMSAEGFYSCEDPSRGKTSEKSWVGVRARVIPPEDPPTDPPHFLWIRIAAGALIFILYAVILLLCLCSIRRWARGRAAARK
ncbi:low affinity immunoglobulin gamma Fc region receptor II-b isoform X2 [Oryzias melastigma]|uniref:Low affinity immunoglobulin gamma Fc region receptor II-b-like n=1 Tax=Oryzias melastigma TaxID=30732 RepID=A0A3B3CTQ4_ORYME|nr:low affinity immunoglobulin gamma Fc region receptor II-b isoform X2 [Oryzias melastigma]